MKPQSIFTENVVTMVRLCRSATEALEDLKHDNRPIAIENEKAIMKVLSDAQNHLKEIILDKINTK